MKHMYRIGCVFCNVKHISLLITRIIVWIGRYGIYPLTAFMAKLPPPVRPRAISPEVTESVKSVTPEPVDVESRRVVNMMCNVKPREESCELLVSDELRKIRV